MRFGVVSLVLLLPMLAGVTGCRTAYYSAYETVGVYKRDLLQKRVVAARNEQQKAQEDFKDALTRLQEITKFDGGPLEREFRRLQSDYDDAAARVQSVQQRISDVETVAKDLFAEWEREIREIGTESLRARSQQQLRETRLRYGEMIVALKRAETTMNPVLKKLNDYVLALKHSLNARAVAALQGESLEIQNDIARLIEDMNASIARADEFIQGFK